MKPFNTDIIDDLALICGRDKVIKDLISVPLKWDEFKY